MSRRVVGSTLVAASLFVGISGAFAAYQAPKADCATMVKDSPNDAIVDYGPTPTQPLPDPSGKSNPAVDITGVTARVASDRVLTYMTITDIPTTMPTQESAYEYDVTFVKGTKSFVFMAATWNSNAVYDSTKPQPFPRALPYDGTAQKTALKDVKMEVDATRNLVIVSAAREEVEAFLGAKLVDGDMFTSIAGKAIVYVGPYLNGLSKRTGDTTPATPTGEQASYTVGTDTCFAPAALTLSVPKAQYGDTVNLTAKLADDTGAALADREVHFSVAGDSRTLPTATTDESGVAVLPYSALVAAGTHVVTATYGGDEAAGRGTASAPLVVAPETTKFGPFTVGKAGTGRTITVALTDDDRTAVAAQKVDWYVNGHKAATTTTDSKGKTVFKGAKAGQSVQARFAAVPGKYAAANSATVKV
jgi:hypothetical protein